jgi:hypothetical protein
MLGRSPGQRAFLLPVFDHPRASIVVQMEINRPEQERIRSRSWSPFDQGPYGVAVAAAPVHRAVNRPQPSRSARNGGAGVSDRARCRRMPMFVYRSGHVTSHSCRFRISSARLLTPLARQTFGRGHLTQSGNHDR